MKRRNFKSRKYQPRPNPIALAMCTLGLRSRVKPSRKRYNRQKEKKVVNG